MNVLEKYEHFSVFARQFHALLSGVMQTSSTLACNHTWKLGKESTKQLPKKSFLEDKLNSVIKNVDF